MDQEQINVIYEEIPLLNVQLSPNPSTMGPGYLSNKIYECNEKLSRANELHSLISREYDKSRNETRVAKLEKHQLERHAMMSPEIRDLQGVGMAEKTLRAEILADEIKKQYCEGNNIPQPEHSLEDTVRFCQQKEEILKTLRDTLNETRTHIRNSISSLRLQHQTIETELKYLRGTEGTGGGTKSYLPSPEADESWENLQGGDDG